MVFERHYTVAQATAMLPRLRGWFGAIQAIDAELQPLFREHRERLARSGDCLGGPRFARYLELSQRWQRLVGGILAEGILIKNLERGLCDFPHILADTGEEVFLCWELSEQRITHWHALDAGYAQRQPLGRLRHTGSR